MSSRFRSLLSLLACLFGLLAGVSAPAAARPLALQPLWESPAGLNAAPAAQSWVRALATLPEPGTGCRPLALPPFSPDNPTRAYRIQPPPAADGIPRILYLQDPITELLVVRGTDVHGCPWLYAGGRSLPFGQRDIASPFPNVELPELAPGSDLQVLIQDRKTIRPWLRLTDRSTFTRDSILVWMGIAGYACILVVIVLVALSFDVSRRNRRTAAYVVYVIALLFWSLQNFGVGSAWLPLWPGESAFAVMQALSVALVVAGIGQAMVHFLELRRWPRHLVIFSVASSSLAFLSSAWLDFGYRLGSAILALLALTVTVILVRRYRQLDLSMRLFTLGFVAIMVGGGTQAASVLNSGGSAGALAVFAFPFGNLAQSLFWLAALGVRSRNDRKALQARLVYDATHDLVTELPNRTLLNKRLEARLAGLQTRPDLRHALLFLDLDRFKVINDSLGHTVGDQLLQNFSRLLEQTCRSHCTIARFGGDEFLILLEQPCQESDATAIAEDILDRLRSPIAVGPRKIRINSSIGIVLIGPGYHAVEDVLRDADTALYAAKHAGRGTYRVFEAQMRSSADRRFELENELTDAIKQGHFQMYYQPIVDIASGRHAGFESLVRWQHPTRGVVSPDEFIPLAEETGLIRDLGRMILRMAIVQVGRWKRDGLWSDGNYVSINVSGEQLLSATLLEEINTLLADNGVRAGDIRIELTETAVIANLDVANVVLPRLRDQGILLCMDDFGTGYSSLSYLSDLPFSVLKIDKSFIDHVVDRDDQRTLVRTILAMADTMALKVVAEGIETPGQRSLLAEMRCGYGQGYLFAKPLAPEAATAWLTGR